MAIDRRTRVVRFLRISMSGVCGLLCALLVYTWVRSYWWNDMIVNLRASDVTIIGSTNGVIYFAPHATILSPGASTNFSTTNRGWGYWIAPARPTANQSRYLPVLPRGTIRIPQWSLVALACTLATLPWLRWRFSLRTLLIAATLVAIVLGLVVYAAR